VCVVSTSRRGVTRKNEHGDTPADQFFFKTCLFLFFTLPPVVCWILPVGITGVSDTPGDWVESGAFGARLRREACIANGRGGN
jgi:hypothetical protein